MKKPETPLSKRTQETILSLVASLSAEKQDYILGVLRALWWAQGKEGRKNKDGYTGGYWCREYTVF
jgi:hypothetical protein